ncbi:MAG TPA: DUF4440 domain-containing protein [Rhizomicrobium sp.]
MKWLQSALVAALLLLPVSAAFAGSIPPDARKTIDAENARWVPSLKAGDVKQALSGFAPDALVISADGKTSSIDAYEAAMQKRFDAGLRITGGQVISNGAELVNGQIVEWGSSLLTAKDKDGPEHKAGGYYLAVWTKNKEGVWQITRNISMGAPQK